MPYSFDKFMTRIVRDEAQRNLGDDRPTAALTEERRREIDPNRQRIQGREHWMNRTRGSWGDR